MSDLFPQRIVCLTEETTEWLYLLGEEARIVGISGYTVRPPRARQEKPKVSAWKKTSCKRCRLATDKRAAALTDSRSACWLKLGFSNMAMMGLCGNQDTQAPVP